MLSPNVEFLNTGSGRLEATLLALDLLNSPADLLQLFLKHLRSFGLPASKLSKLKLNLVGFLSKLFSLPHHRLGGWSTFEPTSIFSLPRPFTLDVSKLCLHRLHLIVDFAQLPANHLSVLGLTFSLLFQFTEHTFLITRVPLKLIEVPRQFLNMPVDLRPLPLAGLRSTAIRLFKLSSELSPDLAHLLVQFPHSPVQINRFFIPTGSLPFEPSQFQFGLVPQLLEPIQNLASLCPAFPWLSGLAFPPVALKSTKLSLQNAHKLTKIAQISPKTLRLV